MFRKIVLSLLLAAATSAAQANWRTATSNNFIVYTEGSEASARDIATRLEKFHYVMRFVAGVKTVETPVKLRVYMVPDVEAVQATMAYPASGMAGYYEDDMHGPYAVMPRAGTGEEYGLKAQLVLFHELSHQFMFHNFPAAYPTWYVEGFADYHGTMQIAANDVVTLGAPVANRYLAFADNNWMSIAKVLGARRYADVDDVGMLYAEGWLLVHYLSTTGQRPGQLKTYLASINAGATFEQAAKTAFGDIGKLDRELRDHAARQKLTTLVLPFKKIDVGPIAMQTLSPAQSAMVPFDIRLSSGIAARNAGNFADYVTAILLRYPDDPTVLADAFEAQRLAGRNAAASSTVDRWLAVAPKDPFALLARAQIDGAALHAAKVTDSARWNAVRAMLLAANRVSPLQPRILRAYYESFMQQGVLPPPGAQNGLVKAFELMPEEGELRSMVAADYEARDMLPEAIATIKPAAFMLKSEQDPKEKARNDRMKAQYRLACASESETARDMLTRLERKQATQNAPAAKATG